MIQNLFSVLFHHYTHSSVSSCFQYSPSSSVQKSFLLLLLSYKIIFFDPIHFPLQLPISAPSPSISFFHFFMQPYLQFPSLQPKPFPSVSSFLSFPRPSACFPSTSSASFASWQYVCSLIYLCAASLEGLSHRRNTVHLEVSPVIGMLADIDTDPQCLEHAAVASTLDCLPSVTMTLQMILSG